MKNTSKAPGLYLHIPFCDTKCGYCDFYSITNNSLRRAFLAALLKEIAYYNTDPYSSAVFDTIYLGGGTPSLLEPREMDEIFKNLFKTYQINSDCEITVEVNPGTIDDSKLAFYKSIGINRLSIGMQSFNDAELKTLGRIHDSRQAVITFDKARKAGFENISIDLIYALPDQKLNSWLKTLKTGLSLNPEHVSAYNLIYEQGTPFYRKLIHGTFIQKNEDEELKFFTETINQFNSYNYMHYEISSYAKSENYYSRHNYKYWDHTFYLSFGPSAHSFWNKTRWSNIRSISQYINKISDIKNIIDFSENLNKETLIFENIMLSLRTYEGINLNNFESAFEESFIKKHEKLNNSLINDGFAYIENDTFKLSPKGMVICDSILSRFAPS